MSYAQDPNGGATRILEENHYYPFGLKHTNYDNGTQRFMRAIGEGDDDFPIFIPPDIFGSSAYKYKYNGKEYQDELGLNVTAMDFRQYDNAIGRFTSIDVLSEFFFDASPYNFVLNNPVVFSDPTGLCPECDENVSNPQNGSSYVSSGGGNYTYNDGQWARQDGELDEVVITPSDATSTTEQVAEVISDFVPGGSIKDIYRGARDGDNLQLAMGIGFLIFDISTFGSGSLIRGGIKTIGKQVVEEVVEQASKKSYKSFRAFKNANGTAGTGNAWHHIVEQNKSNIAKFGPEAIHNVDNLTILPHGKGTLHSKVSGYYSSKQPFTGGQTVRQWVHAKGYEEQFEFGIKVLNDFGWKP